MYAIRSYYAIIALWLIYFHIDLIQSIPYSLIYFSVGLTVPHFVLIAILYKAKSPKEFHTASTINKIIMVLGILFIALAGKAF